MEINRLRVPPRVPVSYGPDAPDRGSGPQSLDVSRTVRGRPVAALLLAVLAVLVLAPGRVSAQTVFQNPDFAYIVDIPAGWELLEGSTTEMISFADPQRIAVFQILAFPGERFVTVDELDGFIRERFGADGDRVPFRYMGQPSLFADYRFSVGRFSVRGYMTFVNGDEYDVAVMTYIPEEYYDQYHDLALSALDSFSPDSVSRLLPGPVSQFFAADLEEQALQRADRTRASLTLPSGASWELPPDIRDPDLVDAHQVMIEREARVLSAYAPNEGAFTRPDPDTPPDWVTAWRRYFRMIFRDSYDRMEPAAEAIFEDLVREGVPREEMPARILTWLQSAEYQRTRSLSDLMSPSSCLLAFAGDCDSLGITYAIILQHLGFDAILMASVEYAHAMVGVDVGGQGARFPFRDRQWLVAELTEEVGIGMIAEDMSDIGGWIGVKLDPTLPW